MRSDVAVVDVEGGTGRPLDRVPLADAPRASVVGPRRDPPRFDRWLWTALVLTVLGLALLVAGYRTNSQTYDEGNHVEAGLEFLERGQFAVEPKHPPLTRVAVALGPYIAGVRLSPEWRDLRPYLWEEGDRVFFRGPGYRTTLTLARLGNLVFYFLLAVTVWAWARTLLGRAGAALAVGFAVLAPPILGHGGLATTDLGVAATLVLAVYCLVRWLDAPSSRRAAAVGGAAALALTSKFTTLPFFGLSLLFIVGWRLIHAWLLRREEAAGPVTTAVTAEPRAGIRMVMRHAAVAAAAFGLVVWAVYGFAIVDLHGVPVPAGQLLRGMKDAVMHNAAGHYSYLLGEWSTLGWWYYFPVVLAVKTPLVLLALGALGAVTLLRGWRADWRVATPLLLVLAVLATGFISHVNIGVRHVLPFYGGWAVLAAAGATALWRAAGTRRIARAAVALLLAWFVADVVRATPHHLAYFNEVSRHDPGHLLVDSNLDWGQDMLRLAAELEQRGVTEVGVMLHSRPVFQQLTRARVRPLERGRPSSGWIAVSETCVRNRGADQLYCGELEWLDRYQPVTRVGRSIRLYHVP